MSLEVGAWPVEEQTWYLGAEPKRAPPHNLNITFIPRQVVLQKVASEANPKVRNHGEGPY